MAELATIARPYANAVFELAKRDNNLDQWSRMLGTLDATSHHETVALLLDSPDMPASAKAFRLAEICGDELDERGKKFLQSLAEHDRLSLISEVRAQCEAQSDALKAALNRRFEKDISIESRVDQSLIGGAVVRAGDMVIDGSIRGKLQKLAENLEQL